jgi:hypothetical protein
VRRAVVDSDGVVVEPLGLHRGGTEWALERPMIACWVHRRMGQRAILRKLKRARSHTCLQTFGVFRGKHDCAAAVAAIGRRTVRGHRGQGTVTTRAWGLFHRYEL